MMTKVTVIIPAYNITNYIMNLINEQPLSMRVRAIIIDV